MTDWLYWTAVHLAAGVAILIPLAAMHAIHGLCEALFTPTRPGRPSDRSLFPN